MKAYLIDLVRAADPRHGRNVAREYLQARILHHHGRASLLAGKLRAAPDATSTPLPTQHPRGP